ncbi:hypothetical protein HAZT_HAZT002354 [Hyalella azteca]|uniref:Neurotransmitter-gated ion-channel transmembrane domain-containing protein n=1 Tax=Hyalella azteca TaxID=294128 RepID=A0A6A0HB17_HYAAZ|nr:hypothetical protein HAZT_HAZT002354 [Hyalella azteca]
MELRNFPMDKQSCPLIISSYAYPEREVRYEWDNKLVTFEAGMTLSQFDLLNTKCTNYSAGWRTDSANYSILQVNFNLQRHTGYFLIQVYVPCFLIVVLSWVSFWLNREATSDRVGLGITTVLTLSTISLDSRTDLPKVHYATALDWFILMSFAYCMATLLQCAGVHYFTKVGSGEALPDGEWQDIEDTEEDIPASTIRRMLTRPRTINSFGMDECGSSVIGLSSVLLVDDGPAISQYRGSNITALSETSIQNQRNAETQTSKKEGFWFQLTRCVVVNSVSRIDELSRILFPVSYGLLNLWYWYSYYDAELINS